MDYMLFHTVKQQLFTPNHNNRETTEQFINKLGI